MHDTKILLDLDIKGIPLFKKGKVRNIYDLGDELLFLATDRISAFDVVMENGIPEKGRVLNMLSAFWFDFVGDVIGNHMITVDVGEMVEKHPQLAKYREELSGRSMLVRKTSPVPVECVVRGYLSGSGGRDYQKTGQICGIELPDNLSESDRLPEPVFTPSTKAETGHDENITQEQVIEEQGQELFSKLRDISLSIYKKASEHALSKGIIIADTKFEFGLIDGDLVLIDEVLTPDSSRFWPQDNYQSGRSQKSFDKQFVRDYLETLDWDKTPPGPELPAEIVSKTCEKYLQAYHILTGRQLADDIA